MKNNIGLTTVDIILDVILKQSYFYNIPPQYLHWVLPVPGGVLRISSDGDDRTVEKIKTSKNPLTKKLTPKKSQVEFPSIEIFQKTDIT